MVGEIPGDEEDKQGQVFVGPAGKLLERAMHDAGLDRMDLYITNAVKHFYFMMSRGMRLHKTPKGPHINACRPWLEAEIAIIKPRVIVTLGATALRSVMKKAVTIASVRGKLQLHVSGALILATFHPSAILRMPDPAVRHQEYERLVADLSVAKAATKMK